MLIISEKKFTEEQIEKYESKGIRYAYGYEKVYPFKHEAVGFILDTLYATSIDRIGYYLKTHHQVSIRYEGVFYKLDNIDEWRRTYQDPKDQIKTKTEMHPVLKDYYEKRKAYLELKRNKSIYAQYERIYSVYPELKDMSEEALTSYIKELAPMYEIDVDYTDKLSLLNSYIQLKFYLDHDIEYSRPANNIQVIPVGDPVLFEDLAYKVQNSQIPIDNIVQSMLK